MRDTIIWQRVEGAAVFLAGLALYAAGDAPFSLWVAILVFLAPDLTFAGYLAGPRIGALLYNTAHVYAFGLIVMAIGVLAAGPGIVAIGTLWVMHSGFDRALGYGLKSTEGFGVTHLGRIGAAK